MKEKSTINLLQSSVTLIMLLLSSIAFAGQKLNTEELNSLLVGSFMKIVYQYEGEGVKMWEYYQKDGTIAGSTDKWGDYSATYKINDEGEICVFYDSEAYSGCYSYERASDNTYKLVNLNWPENSTLDVTVVPGATENINVN